jgi:hypothetical protein
MNRSKIIISSSVISLVIMIIIIGSGVLKHKDPIYSDLDTICFKRDILPVFSSNCGVIGCHDGPSSSAGLVLTDYNSIIKGIIPLKPNKSIVYKSLIGKGASPMPPGNPLSEHERMLIRIWIDQGAENTACSARVTIPGKISLLNIDSH